MDCDAAVFMSFLVSYLLPADNIFGICYCLNISIIWKGRLSILRLFTECETCSLGRDKFATKYATC
jgi:hypothetical protein